MTRLCCHLLLLTTLSYTIKSSVKWDNFKSIYEPYGPRLCREICLRFKHFYYFLKDDLSCRRALKDFVDVDSSCRSKDESAVSAMSGESVCDMNNKDTNLTNHRSFNEAMTQTANQHRQLTSQNISLHQACEEGNLCLIKFIIFQKLTDINLPGRKRRTPVMAAASKGQVEVFNFLVNQGCDLTAVEENKNTVLHIACSGGNTEIVRRLVHSKHGVDSKNRRGVTPVMTASFSGHTAVVKLLVNNSCNIKHVAQYGFNILHMACEGGHVDMVRYIIEKLKCNIESKTYLSTTPVLVAATSGHIDVVKYLAQKGCKMRVKDKNGYNVLHLACTSGNIDLVGYILEEHGFDIESKIFSKRTPVLVAAASGLLKMVKYLAQKGCNMRVTDRYGNNVLHLACASGNIDLVGYILEEQGFDIEGRTVMKRTPVLKAARAGLTEVFHYLVEKGCDLTAVDEDGNTILHMACICGNADVARHVLKKQMVDVDSRDRYRKTPVMKAVYYGRLAVVKCLVDKACDLRAVDSEGTSVLKWAYKGKHDNVINFLKTALQTNQKKT